MRRQQGFQLVQQRVGSPMPEIRWPLAIIASGLAWTSANAQLEIRGIDGELERNVRAFASIAAEACDASPWLLRRRFRELGKETRKALEPFGYYAPTVSTELSFGETCWQATLTVEPGEPVRYRGIHFNVLGEAADDPVFDAGAVLPTTGDILRHADYEALKRFLQVRAADRGYLDAQFVENRLDVWPEEGAVDVTLNFDSGSRYRIRDVIYEQSFLDPQIVDAYIDLEAGSTYDSEDLARAYNDLSDSAYFGRVDVVADVDAADNGTVPIRISLEPGTRIEYTVGAGASTDTGPRFRTGFRNNRINRRGHRLLADFGGSEVIQGISTEYRIPLADPRKEWFSFTGLYVNEDNDTFESTIQRLGLRWTKAMRSRWLRTLSLDFDRESFTVAETTDTTRFVVPGIAFDQKISDRDLFPGKGRRLNVELRGTDESIGSTTAYLQARARGTLIRSLGDSNRFLLRVDAGWTEASDFSQLPPSVRFFAGGDDSVRGFDYESLGPVDDDGNVVGGEYLLVGSFEYERHLRGNFYGAVFVDTGNAFNGDEPDLQTGAGLGLKWRSPLGPIRFYIGYPVSDDDGSVRFHLRLGADL
ncbi:MAG: autotransporter assembly complex family protein [Pseudomonadota bacterium]